MAGSDSIQLYIYNATIPFHVLWDIRCVLADVSFLLEQT